MFQSNLDVNSFSRRDVYPSAVGNTTRTIATGNKSASPAVSNTQESPASVAATIGGQGNIAIAGLIFVLFVFGIMFLAKYLGNDDDFKSLKPSIYNVVLIALSATALTPILKYLAVRFPIPGLSGWILAS